MSREVVLIRAVPSQWMIHIPGDDQHFTQWINLLLVRRIVVQDRELSLWWSDSGTPERFRDDRAAEILKALEAIAHDAKQ